MMNNWVKNGRQNNPSKNWLSSVVDELPEEFKWLANRELALNWLTRTRWPYQQIVCPRCRSERVVKATHAAMEFWCTQGRHYFSLKTSTLMEGSRVSITKWILAVYLEVSKDNGISSSELSRRLRTTQSSAWYLLYRIREAFNTDQPLAEFESGDFFQLDVKRFQVKGQSSKTDGRRTDRDSRLKN